MLYSDRSKAYVRRTSFYIFIEGLGIAHSNDDSKKSKYILKTIKEHAHAHAQYHQSLLNIGCKKKEKRGLSELALK